MNNERFQNIGFNLMRATEATALVASRWVGRGMIAEADEIAAKVMRAALDQIDIDGQIIIGERPHNVAPSILGDGVAVGTGNGLAMDVVVDSIEGVKLLAQGLPDAVSVVATAPRGSMLNVIPVSHLEKLVVSSRAATALRPEFLDAPPAWTLGVIATTLRQKVEDLTVFVLNRPRHKMLIDDIRATGARVILRSEGDVVGALLAATPNSGIDILMGIGGTPEGVVAACAVKAMRGAMLTRLAPQNETEQEAVKAAGLNTQEVLSGDKLVASHDIYFAATGITDGMLLKGVRYHNAGATTHSIVLNGKSGIKRQIYAEHNWENISKS